MPSVTHGALVELFRNRPRLAAEMLQDALGHIDAEIARWCSRPIDTGHTGWILSPLVLGPEGVPVVTDAEQAKAAPMFK